MTPHIQAKKKDFAKTVLMPGDPLRAKWIAENFLTDAKEINSVRGMLGYTGFYRGIKVSVMAHGMGNPSIGIYSYELFSPDFYDVDNIIRIGSCGSLTPDIHVHDVILATSTYSESPYAKLLGINTDNGVLLATEKLVNKTRGVAQENNIEIIEARCYASDAFYGIERYNEVAERTGASVVEMEAFALYTNALFHNKNALCLLTVSDSLATHESLDPLSRQTTFKNMVKIALETAIQL